MAALLRRSRDSSTEDARNQATRDQQIIEDQIAEVQSMRDNDSLKAILGKILINQKKDLNNQVNTSSIKGYLIYKII